LLSNKDDAAAFEYVERSKSRALVDMLAAKQDFSVATGDPARVKELLAAASQAEADLIVQGTAQDKSSLRSAISTARQQLSAESPELASLVSVSSLKASEVQSLIPPDETLLEYYLSGDDLIVFILTSKELKSLDCRRWPSGYRSQFQGCHRGCCLRTLPRTCQKAL